MTRMLYASPLDFPDVPVKPLFMEVSEIFLGSMLDFDVFSSWIYKPLILTRQRTELVELS